MAYTAILLPEVTYSPKPLSRKSMISEVAPLTVGLMSIKSPDRQLSWSSSWCFGHLRTSISDTAILDKSGVYMWLQSTTLLSLTVFSFVPFVLTWHWQLLVFWYGWISCVRYSIPWQVDLMAVRSCMVLCRRYNNTVVCLVKAKLCMSWQLVVGLVNNVLIGPTEGKLPHLIQDLVNCALVTSERQRQALHTLIPLQPFKIQMHAVLE